ncbi:hypothetical protein LGV61_03410 [Desulfurispirillum indicum]|uniref:hypothetical protein n=1 Tax=Desulfurispirillum indicum TaxID=936456 RepID=UPI001CF9E092|nr:hypothetical protein [Desulfurispirillum indicum]UCZ57341.1 hypothetical protein LGV61_03410 [Desulfurispirillum indicum]
MPSMALLLAVPGYREEIFTATFITLIIFPEKSTTCSGNALVTLPCWPCVRLGRYSELALFKGDVEGVEDCRADFGRLPGRAAKVSGGEKRLAGTAGRLSAEAFQQPVKAGFSPSCEVAKEKQQHTTAQKRRDFHTKPTKAQRKAKGKAVSTANEHEYARMGIFHAKTVGRGNRKSLTTEITEDAEVTANRREWKGRISRPFAALTQVAKTQRKIQV